MRNAKCVVRNEGSGALIPIAPPFYIYRTSFHYDKYSLYIERGIGALPNSMRPFHHYALRTSHYAFKQLRFIQHPKEVSPCLFTTVLYFISIRKK